MPGCFNDLFQTPLRPPAFRRRRAHQFHMAKAAPARSLFVAQRCNNLQAGCLTHRHQRGQHTKQ